MSTEKQVRDFHKLGRQVVSREAASGGYGSKIIEKLAEENGKSPSTIRKARDFATLYSERDLNRLCNRVQPNGRSLGIGHVYQLILVQDEKARSRLEAAVARHGWSSRKLEEERRKRLGPDEGPKHGGRPQRPAGNRDDVVFQLEQNVNHVARWCDGLMILDKKGRKVHGQQLAALPSAVQAAIQGLARQLETTLKAVERYKRTRRFLRNRRMM